MNMSETRKPTQMGFNGVFEDIIVDAENALYDGTGVGGGDNVKSALNNIKSRVSSLEQGGGGGGGSSSDKIAYLESLVEQRTLNVEYDTDGKGWNTNGYSVGSTYNGVDREDSYNKYSRARISVKKGDTITIWGRADGFCALYLLVDGDNKVVAKGVQSDTTITEADPATINVTADGILYVNGKTMTNGSPLNIDYGTIREYNGLALATTDNDGMMSSSQVASLQQANPLANKEIAIMGDSFTAGAGNTTWHAQMCAILGAKAGKSAAGNGGRWEITAMTGGGYWPSAYEQAQALVTAYGESAPDYVLIVLGTNDINNEGGIRMGTLIQSSTIGEYGNVQDGEIDPASVIGGMQAAFITLKTAFPNVIIKVGYTPAGYIHDAFGDIDNVETLCQTMKKVALAYGVGYIETRDCGIAPYWSGDSRFYSGAHPTGDGKTRIAQYMARILMSNQ